MHQFKIIETNLNKKGTIPKIYIPLHRNENNLNKVSLHPTGPVQNHKFPSPIRVFHRILSQIQPNAFERAHFSISINGQVQHRLVVQ